MRRHRIDLIAGARPNFMKVAPLHRALLQNPDLSVRLVHTGQHYDETMSDLFFRDLGLPPPQHHLGVGSGTHAEQTAGVLKHYEELCLDTPPELIVVVGDVNSTMAATLVGAKLDIPVGHVEAGLRSFDRSMPEEVNRIVTDQLATLLWTPSEDADANLLGEGVPPQRIERVGNIMIDSLEMLRPTIESTPPIEEGAYILVTLHRPHNVDDPATLRVILDGLRELSHDTRVVFPVHPRTFERLRSFKRPEAFSSMILLEPMGYLSFMSTMMHARLVITDSGGIQEETSYLGIPCITVRPNTERPVTITQGTNMLADPENLVLLAKSRLSDSASPVRPIPLWDGRTANRIVTSIERHFDAKG